MLRKPTIKDKVHETLKEPTFYLGFILGVGIMLVWYLILR